MSNTDGFIEEVSEEVRKDRLYGYLRKYGWIAVLVILATVGGAAYFEWDKARNIADAQNRGDAIVDALNKEAAVDRAAALDALKPEGGETAAFLDIQKAAVLADDDDIEGAMAALSAVNSDSSIDIIYRDLAGLKMIIVNGTEMDAGERDALLLGLSQPGRAFRPLALEYIALFKALDGDSEAAIADFRALLNEPQVSQALRTRVQQSILSLGGDLSNGATLLNDG